MTRKKTNGQQRLPAVPAGGRRSQGTVERHASSDVRALKALEVLPPGTDALQSIYRALGRTFDEAIADNDRYGRINTAREMLRVREALSPIAVAAGGMSIEEMLAEINA